MRIRSLALAALAFIPSIALLSGCSGEEEDHEHEDTEAHEDAAEDAAEEAGD